MHFQTSHGYLQSLTPLLKFLDYIILASKQSFTATSSSDVYIIEALDNSRAKNVVHLPMNHEPNPQVDLQSTYIITKILTKLACD